MKKLLSVILLLSVMLSLCSCGRKYKPQKSTKEESRVVMSLSVDGEEYDIKYELYRALFLANKSKIDGGDADVWTGVEAAEYVSQINEIITKEAAYIYSALHLAHKLDIDVYSSEADDFVDECITLCVEGSKDGSVAGAGSYEKYLGSLKSAGLNYSVCDLMFRYSYALSEINKYYLGEENPALGSLGGAIDTSDESLRTFYYSDECVRVLRAFVPSQLRSYEWAEDFRDDIAACEGDMEKALHIINYTAVPYSELILDGEITGVLIGKHAMDKSYYTDYTNAAFSVSDGGTSCVATVKGTGYTDIDGYYVFSSLAKGDGHFNENKALVKDAYLENEIGKILDGIIASLVDSAEYEKDYSLISHKDISMDP